MVENLTYEELEKRIWDLEKSVSEHKKIEVSLRKSEAKFKGLVEFSSDWIWEIDENGVYNYSSPQVEAILGYKPKQIIGLTHFDIMLPEEADRMAEVFKSIKKKGKPIVALENVCLHKDGRSIVLETSGVPIFDKSGKVIAYRGIDRDITERKLAEKVRERLLKKLYDAPEKVKTLNGLLPICALCKKIRDDKGYWNQLERYIQKYSYAKFSHGMCPECTDEFYGKEDWYIEMKEG